VIKIRFGLRLTARVITVSVHISATETCLSECGKEETTLTSAASKHDSRRNQSNDTNTQQDAKRHH